MACPLSSNEPRSRISPVVYFGGEMHVNQPRFGFTSRTWHAIVAASATILAAFILAGGSVIAARRQTASAERDIAVLQSQLTTKAHEIDNLQNSINKLQQQLAELRRRAAAPTSERYESVPPITLPLEQDEQIIQSFYSRTPLGVEQKNGITISLYACHRVGTAVSCYVTVVSQEHDRDFKINADPSCSSCSNAVDDLGHQLQASRASMAETSELLLLPKGLPVRGVLRFSSVPVEAGRLALIRVRYHQSINSWGGSAEMRFRDIPITA